MHSRYLHNIVLNPCTPSRLSPPLVYNSPAFFLQGWVFLECEAITQLVSFWSNRKSVKMRGGKRGRQSKAGSRPRDCTIRLTSILGFNCFLRFSRLLLKGFGLDCNWLKGIKSAVARPTPSSPSGDHRLTPENSLFFASFVEQFRRPIETASLNKEPACSLPWYNAFNLFKSPSQRDDALNHDRHRCSYCGNLFE